MKEAASCFCDTEKHTRAGGAGGAHEIERKQRKGKRKKKEAMGKN